VQEDDRYSHVPPPPPPITFAHPVGEDGIQPATYSEARAWASRHGLTWNGGPLDVVNRARNFLHQPPVVVLG
jgi:hypothetical protein